MIRFSTNSTSAQTPLGSSVLINRSDWAAMERGEVAVPELNPFRRFRRKAAPVARAEDIPAAPAMSCIEVACGLPYELAEDPLPGFNYVSEQLGGPPLVSMAQAPPPEWFYEPWINSGSANADPSSGSSSSLSSGLSGSSSARAPRSCAAPTPMAAHFDLLRGNFSCSDASSGSMAVTSGGAPALVTPVLVPAALSSSGSSSCTSGSPALSAFSGYPGDGSNTSASTSPALSCLPSPLGVSSAKGIPSPLIFGVTCDPSETHRPRSSTLR